MTRFFTLILVLAVLLPVSADAQEIWQEEWREFGAFDLALTAGLGAVIATTQLVGAPEKPRWNREILLDLPTRRLLGTSVTATEDTVAHISDGLVMGLLVAPFADLAVVTYDRHDVKFAETFSGVALESLAMNFAATNLVKVLVARERPLRAECFGVEGVQCPWREPVSFFSGHSSGAFTGAGLVCALETVGDIRGDGIGSAVPCVSALTLAATTAVLRVVANKHHLSDVIVGSLVGLGAGWLWPTVRFGWSR